MLFDNVAFGRHKGKKYVNVFVKNIGISRMVERLGKYKETCYFSVTIEISLAVNLVINHYLSESCYSVYPMARASRLSYSLPYNWPPKSDLLLRNSLLELLKFLK